ncbi:MAG TPA: hypothetical protein VMV75_03245 [Sulfuricella sp.]|nr:hypothetical protein [Sulfuricella sp.]
MLFRAFLPGFLFLAALLPPQAGAAGREAPRAAATWVSRSATGEIQVHLYFFWSKRCPHCLQAQPFVERLASDYPWLTLHSAELSEHPENIQDYIRMASGLGRKATFVPAFLLCGEMRVGFDAPATTGEELRKALLGCRENALHGRLPDTVGQHEPSPVVPLLGAIDPAQASLPLFTIAIAALDAFNPCAFFVLLFLLGLLVHGGSRVRMLVIGGVFVFFSGLVYFVFMAAWLNAFLLMKELQAATRIAGMIAVAIALINIKDYFWFKRGISLSIPESARPGLFRRMRGLAEAASWPAMLAGTAALALAANTYELFCTAGFPMVFTRVLTLRNLPGADYYLYLLLYNVVYVLPLLAIMLAFVFTLGTRKLTERQGRILKLLSGSMMLELGGALILAPDILNSVRGSAALLAASGAVTALIVGVDGWLKIAKK